ncbi:hypothetical protein Q7P37_002062 [Cladosporium fusiforme]
MNFNRQSDEETFILESQYNETLLNNHGHTDCVFFEQQTPATLKRAVSTLPNNKHIYVHEQLDAKPRSYLLSFLPDSPPTPSLAIGSSPTNPPTTDNLKENPEFFKLLHWIIKEHAAQDPDVKAAAAMYASQAGSTLGSGGMFFPQQKKRKRRASAQTYGGGGGAGGDGAGGASSQGGAGGGGRGGYIHVSDQRNPPDFGRVAWPEDIFGSLELDGEGNFVDGNGRYQEAGTYRACTNEGVLGLSPFLREKLVERLKELHAQAKQHA